MRLKSKKLVFFAAFVATAAGAASAFLITRASSEIRPSTTQDPVQRRRDRGARNLSLRPEALSVSRRLGNRFKPTSRAVSTTVGNLTIGNNQQPITIVRRQTKTGETIELLVGNRRLNWNEQEGTRADAGALTSSERLLAERVVIDSPDQFVLAQLRGASYVTVARNVRPTDAGDDYRGPLWNLVRVDEPPQDESSRPVNTWRIFYINAQTGLPDRIEYQLNGQDIRTDFAEWTEQNGEKTPSRVTWSSGGQVLMEYRATQVSHN